MTDEIKKKRGRPPLSPEVKEARRVEQIKKSNEWHKNRGYAAQKRYKAAHPEKRSHKQNYEPRVRIPLEFKPVIEGLAKKTGLSITQLFVSAAEEKYDVVLHRDIDKGGEV